MTDIKKVKVIAFYLPQYHPTKDNDEWWGKGFTEWTNVKKAKSLYRGHYQPKIPKDLGYYDLRDPEIRYKQAELAQKAGIDGFCYYHYWFGNGKRELELPFKEVVKSGEPAYPFCLCWANESWHQKFWNKDGTSKNKLLVEQLYPGEDDYRNHFYELLPAFKDDRYLKIDGKPIFMIYKPLQFKDVGLFIDIWQRLASENGITGIYFIGQTINKSDINEIISLKFDAVNLVRLYAVHQTQSVSQKIVRKLRSVLLKAPFVYSYRKAINKFVGVEDSIPNVFPTLIPNWDHTPRSNYGGFVLHDSTPKLFKKHVKMVFDIIKNKKDKDKVVFIKSWNEWGEGNYLEPDEKHGDGFLKVLEEVIFEKEDVRL